MKSKAPSTRAILAIGTLMIGSQVWGSDNAMSCVKDLAIPSAYSTIQSEIPATIEARILIGDHGKAERVTYDTDFKLLTLQLDAYFKQKTRYVDSCKGRIITFTVRYTLVEPELDVSASEVHFEPPDRFLVICHRLRPSLDPVRTKNLK